MNLDTTTTVVIRVTAQDGETMQEYIIAVKRLPNTEASLADIEITGVESGEAVDLLPDGFAIDTTDYTAEVAGDLNIKITANASDDKATVQIAKTMIEEGTPSFKREPANAEISLNLKTTTTIVIRVTAEDGQTIEDYAVAVKRLPEADASLEELTLTDENGGEIQLMPGDFDPAAAEYTVEVEGDLEIELNAKATHDKAVIQIDGESSTGQAITLIPLQLETTTSIVILVSSEDGSNMQEYIVAVKRLPSSDASLDSLEIIGVESNNVVDLLPSGFAIDTTEYTAEVAGDLNIRITAQAEHSRATVQIAREEIMEDTPSFSDGPADAEILLNLKTTTTIVILVMAEDGTTTQSYTIAVNRLPEADASLEALTITDEDNNEIQLMPDAFDPTIAEYTAEIVGDSAIMLNAKATHDKAMIQIAGVSTTGQAITLIPLNLGTTTGIVIQVTSEDGENTQEYTVVVEHLLTAEAALLEALEIVSASDSAVLDLSDQDQREYTAEIVGDLSIRINAETRHSQATFQIAKTMITAETPSLSNGQTSASIELNPETTTTIVILVTPEGGGTTQEYTLAVSYVLSSDASLKSLGIISVESSEAVDLLPGGFASTRIGYMAEVVGDLNIRITAEASYAQATIQIAKTMMEEGTPSTGTASSTIGLDLDTTTTVVIRVTAQDGETMQEYTVAVKRLPNTDASLTNLEIVSAESNEAVGLLPGGFAIDTTEYTAEVTSDLNIRITANASDDKATIQIAKTMIEEGTGTPSTGTASSTIDLNLDTTTTVVIRVIAEDGQTMEDYTVAVKRLPSSNASLENLELIGADTNEKIQLLPDVFTSTRLEYAAEVAGDLSIRINVKTMHSQAMIQINGEEITEGTDLIRLNLRTTTTVVILVIAEDGETTKSYSVAVKRLPTADASLEELTITGEDGKEIQLMPDDFNPAVTKYTAEVEGDLEIELEAKATREKAVIQIAKAMIQIDGESSTGQAVTLIPLELETTTSIVILVIAEDGETTKSYSVAVKRLPSSDASLESLEIAAEDGTIIQLMPAFSSTGTEYTAEAQSDQDFAEIEVTGIPTHPQAKIEVTRNTETTTIQIQVTAEDGKTTQDYTIEISYLDGIGSQTIRIRAKIFLEGPLR